MSEFDQLPIVQNALTYPAPDNWLHFSRQDLSNVPFSVQEQMFHRCFQGWSQPPVAWRPQPEDLERAHLTRWMKMHDQQTFDDMFRFSTDRRKEFWQAVIDDLKIPFKTPPSKSLDLSDGVENPKWLPQAKLNIVDACFLGQPDQDALVYKKSGSSEIQRLSFAQLKKITNRVSNSLVATGFQPGDAIAIDMPMTWETVAIYLGIAQMGGVVVSIADSFAPEEIAVRLKISKAKAAFTQDVVFRGEKKLPMYEKVVAAGVERAIVLPAAGSIAMKLRSQDLAWADFLGDNDSFESVACNAEDATNILFSSGTTGEPKAIPWTHVTPIKGAADGMFHHDIHDGDVVAWPTNLGWMMGPWLIYAALMNRAAIALCEDPPMTEEFGRFVQDAKVTMLGLVPSIVKSWRKTGSMEQFDWSHIRCFSSTGEASNPDDYLYLMSLANYRPVIEYCGGTEIGGGYVTGTMVQDASPSTFTTPALGLDFVVLNDEHQEVDEGELFIIPPSMGLSNTLLNKDHYQVYFEGSPEWNGHKLRRHGDQILKLSNGYYRAQGRADDTMNLGGIKTSSAEIERVCNGADGVIETAAIAVPPSGGGPDRLIIYSVGGRSDIDELTKEFQQLIKQKLNPLFKVHETISVEKLPRTASNKVMRRVLRSQYLSQHG